MVARALDAVRLLLVVLGEHWQNIASTVVDYNPRGEIPAACRLEVVDVTRPIAPPDVNDLHRAHEAGETIDSIRRRLNVTAKVVVRWFRQAGYKTRTQAESRAIRRGYVDAELPTIHARYMAGKSSVDLAHEFGCHSSTLRKAFGRAGLEVRTISGAMATRMASMPAQDRARITAAAHDAVRGKQQSLDHRRKIAATKERLLSQIGPDERRPADLLCSRGLSIDLQRAVGKYNLDVLADGAVAVELFGGGWHAVGRHASRHNKRVRDLLDAGLDVVVIWIHRSYGDAWIRGLDEVVSLAQSTSGNPSALRQYRVIWSDGEVVTRLDANANDFPPKPAFVMRRNASGRYERAR